MKDKSIQEEIRVGVANIVAGFRGDKTLDELPIALQGIQLKHAWEILEYLDSKGVVVATWHEGDLYDGFERLVEE